MPSSARSLVLLIALAAVLYVVGNARVSLWDRDEPRYAQTSRQMLASGDSVVPRYLDKVRTAKPVFIYWCQASAMAVLGADGGAGVFAARLPSAVAMTGVLALVAAALWRSAGPAHAFWATLVLATSALVVWSAKACTTDAVLLAGVTVAQLCLYQLWRGRATWPVVIAMALAIGQAGLTKGPVVLGVMAMTLLALGLFRAADAWLARRRAVGPELGPDHISGGLASTGLSSEADRIEGVSNVGVVNRPLDYASPQPFRQRPGSRRAISVALKAFVGIAMVVALVGPWLYLVARREAGFLGTSVSHDVFTRIAKPLEGHSGPPGYHLALIFATFLPWSVLLPMAVVSGWQRRADPRLRFALAAVLGPWIMFELVQTKLPHYMLPVFPPLAFLTADAIVRCLRGEKDDLRRPAFRAAAGVLTAVVLAAGAGTVVLAVRFGDPVIPAAALALAALAFGVAVFVAFLRQRVTAGLLVMGIGMAAVYAVLYGLYLPSAGVLRVSARAAEILSRVGATGMGDAIMLDYKEPSLAFYQGGTIRENSAMVLSHELLDAGPPWLVVTAEVWEKTPADVRARVEVVDSVRGLAYADGGRVVEVMMVRNGRSGKRDVTGE